MANNKQQPQVVYVERKPDRSLLWFLLFGWLWVGWVVLKWAWGVITWPIRFGAKVGWVTLVEWPWKATVAACRWTVRGVQALIEQQKSGQGPQS